MPDLGCSVKSCMHNWDQKCDKEHILVEGDHACSPRETCCGSFEDAKDNGYKDVTHHVDQHVDVDCEAVECIFNEQRHCAANRIGIAGSNACDCSDTECSSFETK